jgi:hypothetical protein
MIEKKIGLSCIEQLTKTHSYKSMWLVFMLTNKAKIKYMIAITINGATT